MPTGPGPVSCAARPRHPPTLGREELPTARADRLVVPFQGLCGGLGPSQAEETEASRRGSYSAPGVNLPARGLGTKPSVRAVGPALGLAGPVRVCGAGPGGAPGFTRCLLHSVQPLPSGPAGKVPLNVRHLPATRRAPESSRWGLTGTVTLLPTPGDTRRPPLPHRASRRACARSPAPWAPCPLSAAQREGGPSGSPRWVGCVRSVPLGEGRRRRGARAHRRVSRLLPLAGGEGRAPARGGRGEPLGPHAQSPWGLKSPWRPEASAFCAVPSQEAAVHSPCPAPWPRRHRWPAVWTRRSQTCSLAPGRVPPGADKIERVSGAVPTAWARTP